MILPRPDDACPHRLPRGEKRSSKQTALPETRWKMNESAGAKKVPG
jgi:hypothetical protein